MKNNRGFSLVELLIVVAIIATLAGIGIPRYLSYKAKSRRAECLTIGSNVSKKAAVMMLKNDVPPCSIRERGNPNSPNAGSCIGTLKYPIAGVTYNDTAKQYYILNVSAGGTYRNDWYPRVGRNAMDKTISVSGMRGGTPYGNVDYAVSCAGRIYNKYNRTDEIIMTSSGTIKLWGDNVTNQRYTSDAAAKSLK